MLPRINILGAGKCVLSRENHHCEKHGNTQISPSYERGWPLACLDGLIKSNQTSDQGARWTSSVSMLKVHVFALIIETSAVWPWCRRSFQDISRTVDNYSWAYLWFISHDLSHGVPLMSIVYQTTEGDSVYILYEKHYSLTVFRLHRWKLKKSLQSESWNWQIRPYVTRNWLHFTKLLTRFWHIPLHVW
jgi:hypothetical protein